MTKERQLELFDQYTSHLRSLIQSKGDDYAGADRLFNFKHSGEMTGRSASQHCLSMIATKVSRLATLLQNDSSPNHESISDSCLDGANYFFLLAMLQDEVADTQFEPKSQFHHLEHISKDRVYTESHGLTYLRVDLNIGRPDNSIGVLASDVAALLDKASSMFGDITPRLDSLDFYVPSFIVTGYIIANGPIKEDFPFRYRHLNNDICLFEWTGDIPS